MGVETRVLLTNPPDIIEILKHVTKHYRLAKLVAIRNSDTYRVAFRDGDDERVLSVFPPGCCAGDYADVHTGPAVLISMGCWGGSEAIARRLVAEFGGMMVLNDCTDEWQTAPEQNGTKT